jgi:hypothetical protein
MPLPLLAEGVDQLLDVSSEVLDISEAISKSRSETARRVAIVLDSIVGCLDRIAVLARKGDHQACCGACEELGVYLENFANIDGLPNLAGADRIDLLNALGAAVRARRGMYIANSLVGTGLGRDAELANIIEIDRAAGKFRAASALARAEIAPPQGERARTRKRVVWAIATALAGLGLAYAMRH